MPQAPNWITDRQPTALDGDDEGEVVVLGKSECGDLLYCYSHWSLVQPGEPWFQDDSIPIWGD